MIAIRSVLVIVTAVVLHVSLFSGLRILDVAPEVPLALATAIGMTGGTERGVAAAFGLGLLIDMYLPTPLGLGAMSFGLVAFLVGLANNSVVAESWFNRAAFCAAGSAIGLTVFVFCGELLGLDYLFTPQFPKILAVVVLENALLGIVLVPLTMWMWDSDEFGRPRFLRSL